MHRREVIKLSSTGLLGFLTGCSSRDAQPSATVSHDSADASTPNNKIPGLIAGTELPIPKSELVQGAARNGISAIKDPAFGRNWEGIEITIPKNIGSGPVNTVEIQPRLSDEDEIIGVTQADRARAYPLKILNWHEVVNDSFGQPLLITYCPLCRSGVTAERRIGNEPTTFGVSGFLFNSNLVMYDTATNSLWSQIAATAIRGPETGTQLSLVASTLTTWDEWRQMYPDTEVLLPPPKSKTIGGRQTRDYRKDPYDEYEHSRQQGIQTGESSNTGLHPKMRVLGVVTEDAIKAYPLDRIAKEGVVNDTVGSLPVVIAVNANKMMFAYIRRLDNQTVQFHRTDSSHMRAGGSKWEIATGRAVDGPHENEMLDQANDQAPMYWFAWRDFHPETELFQAERN